MRPTNLPQMLLSSNTIFSSIPFLANEATIYCWLSM